MPNKLLLLAVGFMAFAVPKGTFADAQLRIQMGFPAVLPPLVEIQPGVRVVQDFDDEIFFARGYYWVQRDGNWYRARDHRGTWNYVRSDRAPRQLVRYEPGRYRRWQHDEGRSWPDARQHARRGGRHWRSDERQPIQPWRGQQQPQPPPQRSDGRGGDRRGN
jgi:hypothetical protein